MRRTSLLLIPDEQQAESGPAAEEAR